MFGPSALIKRGACETTRERHRVHLLSRFERRPQRRWNSYLSTVSIPSGFEYFLPWGTSPFRVSKSMALIVSHIAGDAPLPWPVPNNTASGVL